jgi:hypothetical protein
MKDLAQKIKNTALFSSDEKVEILASIETFSDSDKLQLADIVDEYDRKFSDILSTFKQNMNSKLDEMEKSTSPANVDTMREAVGKIKSGLDVIAVSPTS